MSLENVGLILKIVLPIVSFLIGFIPVFIGLINSIKKRKQAKTEEEKAKAEADMLIKMNECIQSVETLYSSVDTALKEIGETAGPMKKDSAMTKLQAYALSKGYPFDSDKWSSKIDEQVEFTRNVNFKK